MSLVVTPENTTAPPATNSVIALLMKERWIAKSSTHITSSSQPGISLDTGYLCVDDCLSAGLSRFARIRAASRESLGNPRLSTYCAMSETSR